MDSAEIKPPSASTISGKLVIVGIVTVAVCAAAISWWFRYNATHRAAKFWGPEAVALIRDAPQVTLIRLPFWSLLALAFDANAQATLDKNTFDISKAHGLVHLRNALLEDHNYTWLADEKPSPTASTSQYWVLRFGDRERGKGAILTLSKDCTLIARAESRDKGGNERIVNSTEPMAKGLREMFAEFIAASPSPPAESSTAEPAR
jgi:hypothetical protein